MGAELVHSKYRAEGTQLHGTRTMRTERPSCLGCVSKRVRGTWTCDGDACTRQKGDPIYPVHLFSAAPRATTVPKAFSFARIAGAVRPASRLFLHLRWHVPPKVQEEARSRPNSSRNPCEGECLRHRRRPWCSGEEVHWIDGVAFLPRACVPVACPCPAHAFANTSKARGPFSSHGSRSMQLCALCSVLGVY